MTEYVDPNLVTSAVERNVAIGTQGGSCNFCDRVGLPVLPVRYAVVDTHQAEWPAGLPWALARYAQANFPRIDRARYVLRLMREGYLYLYDEARQRWQAWMITSDSRLCEFPPRGRPPSAKEDEHVESPCSVPANNLSALLLTIPEAQRAQTVYVAYSDHLWTSRMLDDMASNQDGVRDRAMQPFDVASWLASQSSESTTKPADLATFVPEFGSTSIQQLCDGDCFPYLSPSARQLLDADQLVERMNWIVRDTPELVGKGAMLAIEDPIGITASLNQFRNNAKQRLDDYAFSEEVHTKKVTSEMIVGVRSAIRKAARDRANATIERVENGPLGDVNLEQAKTFENLTPEEQGERWERMPSWQRERIADARERLAEMRAAQAKNSPEFRRSAISQSWEKYQERYDEDARQAFEESYGERIDEGKQEIEERAEGHLSWLTSDSIVDALKSYDTESLSDGRAYETAVASMVTGASLTARGSEILAQLLERPIIQDTSFYWRALFLNQKSCIDTVWDYVASSADWGSKLYGPLSQLLSRDGENGSRLENLIADAVRIIGEKLSRLDLEHVARNQIARAWQSVGWARFDIRTSLTYFDMDANRLDRLYDDFLWRGELSISDMRGENRRLAPSLDELSQQEQRVWAMVPQDLVPQQHQQALLGHDEAGELINRRMNLAMTPSSGGALFLVGLELINSWKALTALNGRELAKSGSNLVASSAALTSALAGAVKELLGGLPKESALYKNLTWANGIGGALASWIGAYWMFSEAAERRAAGDPIYFLYVASGVAATLSGFASIAAAAQSISGAGAFAVRFALIGRICWAAVAGWVGWVALGLAILSSYLIPDDLEKWLGRTVFGKDDNHFESLQETMDAFTDMAG
ncbi:T6SS effector BTH_I2691 family protein [Chromohalobacter israelensis]|uniref:Toxin VasX N-terminal region domain-containing protein n=1 Tax=Chromohalobacter israelensis (strain ATCC BAA-138 / DSM 3043 / CIP 106854 / NCIMB 13768 / 1H11) TaxID=290398 RepID=Q1QVA6_CHRI1|nr:T6SS effector BTH_I2691 family protein [Chromohalobacter salexigens]ABE59602.1 hypothetical protein Csal_2252 [Chromohalobacter salexigens DSM 3043]